MFAKWDAAFKNGDARGKKKSLTVTIKYWVRLFSWCEVVDICVVLGMLSKIVSAGHCKTVAVSGSAVCVSKASWEAGKHLEKCYSGDLKSLQKWFKKLCFFFVQEQLKGES